MRTSTVLSKPFFRLGLSVLALSLAGIASAGCIKDLRGEVYCGAGRCLVDNKGVVWCSRYHEGDAKKTLDGRVLCGKGQCERDINGAIYCSSVISGAVLVDSRGSVRCYGQCEPATAESCENTRADSSED